MTMERKASMAAEPHVNSAFEYERDLVDAFVGFISQSDAVFGIAAFGLEFDYQRGRTDVVAVANDGRVIAFEAKLRNWREALHQAYRNTCFATESYILMPLQAARRAACHAREFENRGVGICAFTEGSIEVLHPASRRTEPLEPWLSKRAAEFASAE